MLSIYIQMYKYIDCRETSCDAFNVYCRELAPSTVSLTGDRAQGDDSKHCANSSTKKGDSKAHLVNIHFPIKAAIDYCGQMFNI